MSSCRARPRCRAAALVPRGTIQRRFSDVFSNEACAYGQHFCLGKVLEGISYVVLNIHCCLALANCGQLSIGPIPRAPTEAEGHWKAWVKRQEVRGRWARRSFSRTGGFLLALPSGQGTTATPRNMACGHPGGLLPQKPSPQTPVPLGAKVRLIGNILGQERPGGQYGGRAGTHPPCVRHSHRSLQRRADVLPTR